MPRTVKYIVNYHERLAKNEEIFEKIEAFNDIITPLHIEIGEDGSISKVKLSNFRSIYTRGSAASAAGSAAAPSPAAAGAPAGGLGTGPAAATASTGSSAPIATTGTPSSFTAGTKTKLVQWRRGWRAGHPPPLIGQDEPNAAHRNDLATCRSTACARRRRYSPRRPTRVDWETRLRCLLCSWRG
jgi:hypothetical protein